MNKDDITRMAREAGFTNPARFDTDDENLKAILEDFWVNLERFFHMAQAAEREACIKALEDNEQFYCRDTIRARGQA